jgi:t-SNARE complex subunit (syntaxin)
LLAAEGVIRINDSSALASSLTHLLHDRKETAAMSERALRVLKQHADATERSITMLERSVTSNRTSDKRNGIEHANHQAESKTEPVP